MSIQNLEYMFNPKSVVLVGASTRDGSLGSVLADNLLQGGFKGSLFFVNPKYTKVHGHRCLKSIAKLEQPVDLAIICTPARTVPKIIDELGQQGTSAAVVISAGFSEGQNEDGKKLQQAMLDAAQRYTMRIIGPNCLGILIPGARLNASFAHLDAPQGKLAFITQSGAIVTSILDWAAPHNIGFSHLVSLGDMSDVDFGDMLDYLARDRHTRAILLYMESVTHARKFMSAARAASRVKPVIVVKSGRYEESAKAASSHTGALAGKDEVYDSVFRRAGMLRVDTLEELFDAAEVLAMDFKSEGNRVAIMTNGGGLGVMATDEAIRKGAKLAELSESTLAQLNEVLPTTWSHANPVDIIGDADGERYAKTLEILCKDKEIDAILALNCPTGLTSSIDAAETVIDTAKKIRCNKLLTSWVGSETVETARKLFAHQQIPSYETPEQAVRAFMHRVNYQVSQTQLMETPPSIPEKFVADSVTAKNIIEQAIGENRYWLSEAEAKNVLAAYEIPTVTTEIATTPKEAAAKADKLGLPVALKILSHDITHKSDVGGVALDIKTPRAVKKEAKAMLERVSEREPEARIEGFTVQPMIDRSASRELIIGMSEDRQFGPVLLFGQGGTAVELMDDKAIMLPPLNMRLARLLISRTRIARLLRGFRDQAPADLDAVALTLLKVSQLTIDIPQITELDINPLLANESGVIALDARIKVTPRDDDYRGEQRLAIRPYPKELEEEIEFEDGETLLLRPIRPEDEPALQEGFAKLSNEEKRLRFFSPIKSLSHKAAARFTQIDYDREMALVLTEKGIPGKTDLYGSVRLICDASNHKAEYAIIVGKEMTGKGLGRLMMKRIVQYGRSRGLKEIYGDVLGENTAMLRLCHSLGFTEEPAVDDPGVVRVTLKL